MRFMQFSRLHLYMLVIGIGFTLLYATTWGETANTKGDEDDFEKLLEQEEKARQVNEGKLVFLAKPPEKPVHHQQNHVILIASSLLDGWVQLIQCHHHLDAMSRVEVVYKKDTTRKLRVKSSKNIERVWVEDSSVQLSNVKDHAELCVEVESKALTIRGDGTYYLRHGPFMRKFLDGYYPMRVSVDVELPAQQLILSDTFPMRQQGYKVWETANAVHVDAWFEGRLYTEFVFKTALKKN